MLDTINTYINTYQPAEFVLTYREYLAFISTGKDKLPVKTLPFIHYEKVFNSMLTLKQDFFYIGEMFYLLTQLLFAARFVEVSSITFTNDDKRIAIKITSAKGTGDRLFLVPIDSPLVNLLINIKSGGIKQFSYKEYNRALKKANPNFYNKFNTSHLAVSHIARHFYVQSLKYVLKYTNKKISDILGWKNEETLKSYTDKTVFKDF